MLLNIFTSLKESVNFKAAAIAGTAAGAAYVATMEAGVRLFEDNLDDLKLLGWPLVRNKDHAELAGLAPHFANSIALAVLYAAAAAKRFPGPPWFRGLAFVSIETVALYPTAMLENRHPAIREGKIDRFWSWSAFAKNIPRHVAYGLVLGVLYDKLSSGR